MVQKGEGRRSPGVFKEGLGENRWRRVMRFRLGSEVREGRYWVVEERKVCRLCGGEMER